MTVLAIDERPTMAEDRENSSIKVSNGALTVILFILADTLGGVWWASSANAKINMVLDNQARQVVVDDGRYKELREKEETDKAELQSQINIQATWNQQLREKLASKGILK